jgi:membrane associated rhomboid family serine protease
MSDPTRYPVPSPSPRDAEPAIFAPLAILLLMAALVAIHALRVFGLGLYEDGDLALLRQTAFVPARFSISAGLVTLQDVLRDVAAAPADVRPLRRFLAQVFLADGASAPWTLVTYAFLHAGWEHVVFNSLWLLVFGSPVMQRFGVARFAAFFAVTAAVAALFHVITAPKDVSVLLGASGAVSGLTAAALRFAFAGAGFGLGFGPHVVRAPAPPLREALSDRRVMIFVAVWFGLNLLAGLGMPVSGGADTRIAWEAHVGGFLAGLLLFPLFDPVRPR